MPLSVRKTLYRGVPGFLVSGRVPQYAHKQSIFFKSEAQAREYVRRFKAGEDPRDILRALWPRNPFWSGLTTGLGVGAGFAVVHGMAEMLKKRNPITEDMWRITRSKNPRYAPGRPLREWWVVRAKKDEFDYWRLIGRYKKKEQADALAKRIRKEGKYLIVEVSFEVFRPEDRFNPYMLSERIPILPKALKNYLKLLPKRNPIMPPFVAEAIRAYKREGRRGIDWIYFRLMSAEDKKQFDRWLVSIKHPLAYEPGTNEYRFYSYVKQVTNPTISPELFFRTLQNPDTFNLNDFVYSKVELQGSRRKVPAGTVGMVISIDTKRGVRYMVFFGKSGYAIAEFGQLELYHKGG